MQLLSESAKTNKSLKAFPGYDYFIQYLQPRFASGQNTCPFSTAACRATCLQSCGRLRWSNAKVERTDLFFDDPEAYYQKLYVEITDCMRKAKKKDKQLALRLNGTTDIDFEKVWTDPKFASVQFNEYTKNPNLATKYLEYRQQGEHANVHFTLSYSGRNGNACKDYLNLGGNVAVVFETAIPDKFEGFKVISGDTHDFRFKDEPGVVVGLIAKAPIVAKEEKAAFIKTGIDGGFIIPKDYDPSSPVWSA